MTSPGLVLLEAGQLLAAEAYCPELIYHFLGLLNKSAAPATTCQKSLQRMSRLALWQALTHVLNCLGSQVKASA